MITTQPTIVEDDLYIDANPLEVCQMTLVQSVNVTVKRLVIIF